MNQIFGLLTGLKYPCLAYDQAGICIYQNELFNLHFADSSLKGELNLMQLSYEPSRVHTVNTHAGEKIQVKIEIYDLPLKEPLKVAVVIRLDEEWDDLSIQKIESHKLVALGQMASGIAHEINNPLTVVLSKLHLIEQSFLMAPTNEASKHRCLDAIQKAKSNITRISKIIKGLRNLSRDTRADGFEHKDLNEVIDDALVMCEERMKNQGLILKRQIEETNLTAPMQPVQISQVLINILNNAIDALSESNLGEIEVSTFREHDYVVCRIKDSGPGIPEIHQNMIMTPFYTTKPSGIGTGLGLSISHQIMQSHNGSLKLNTKISSNCFEIRIPKSGELT